MIDLLDSLARWGISITSLAAVIIFLGRSALAHFFSRDVERFKAELQKHAAIEIERTRHELEQQRLNYETRFRWSHTRRAQALDDLYEHWITAVSAVHEAANTTIMAERMARPDIKHVFGVPIEEARTALVDFKQRLRAYRPILQPTIELGLSAAAEELEELLFRVKMHEAIKGAEGNRNAKQQNYAMKEVEDLLNEIDSRLKKTASLEDKVLQLFRQSFGEIGDLEARNQVGHNG